jgi:hypothetical protein
VVCASKRLPSISHDTWATHHFQVLELDSEKLAAAKTEFKQLKEDNIFQYSASPCSSLLHMVRKKNGSSST